MKTLLKLFLLCVLAVPGFGQLATPVSVTSVTVSSTTATVTTGSAHGLSAGQGFCDLASSQSADIICSTVATVPSSTTFTYVSSTAVACSSSCGTNQPARRFIWANVDAQSDLGEFIVQVCVWLTTATPAPLSGGSSACSSATANENAAIAAGTTVEKVYHILLPGSYALSDANTFMNKFQQSKQSAFANTVQPGAILGHSCDSVGCN